MPKIHGERPRFPRSAAAVVLAACAAAALGATPPAPDTVPVANAPHAASGGRIEGVVVLGPKLSSKRMRFHLYNDTVAVSEATSLAPADEKRNVVIYLEPLGAGSDAALPAKGKEGHAPVRSSRQRPSGPLAIRQEGLEFLPHVLPVLRGTTVEFPNADPVFHNVFSLSGAASFDLGRYPKGDAKSVRFDAPGVVKVFCHIHSDMSAVILVLDTPYFGTPERDGRFGLDGIPAGEYRVVAWHERARPVSHKVKIVPGETAVVDFNIPLTDAADGG